MRRFAIVILSVLIFIAVGLTTACNGGGEPKKKAERSDSDWSSSSVVKDIEEMKKASEKGKAPAQTQATPDPAVKEPKK